VTARPKIDDAEVARIQLIDDLLAERERVSLEVVDRLQAAMECYRALSVDQLLPVVRGNVEAILQIVRRRDRKLSDDELAWFAEVGEARSDMGLPIADVLRGWRLGIEVVSEDVVHVGRKRGVADDILLDLTQEMFQAADQPMVAFVTGHHRATLERARDEDHVRAELVRRVLRGLVAGAELREQCAVWGLDPDCQYVTFRARTTSRLTPRELERILGLGPVPGEAPRGLAAVLDGDLAGFAVKVPHRTVNVPVGLGPPAALGHLEPSFRLATRAVATAAAFGLHGVFDLDALGMRAAIIADTEVGDRLVRRYIEPVEQGGRSAAALLEAIECYLACGLRAEAAATELRVHPNTLRYRLSRFEQLTGANLHNIAVVAEVWWALHRRRQRDFGETPKTDPPNSEPPP
jgi:hypothetical protein